MLRFLRDNYPAAFGAAAIRSYGQPGIRMTRWIVGRDHLTADAVRQGVRTDDAVARCSWPIELHDKASGVHWEEFGDDRWEASLQAASALPPAAILDRIIQQVDTYAAGAEQHDDITVMALRVQS